MADLRTPNAYAEVHTEQQAPSSTISNDWTRPLYNMEIGSSNAPFVQVPGAIVTPEPYQDDFFKQLAPVHRLPATLYKRRTLLDTLHDRENIIYHQQELKNNQTRTRAKSSRQQGQANLSPQQQQSSQPLSQKLDEQSHSSPALGASHQSRAQLYPLDKEMSSTSTSTLRKSPNPFPPGTHGYASEPEFESSQLAATPASPRTARLDSSMGRAAARKRAIANRLAKRSYQFATPSPHIVAGHAEEDELAPSSEPPPQGRTAQAQRILEEQAEASNRGKGREKLPQMSTPVGSQWFAPSPSPTKSGRQNQQSSKKKRSGGKAGKGLPSPFYSSQGGGKSPQKGGNKSPKRIGGPVDSTEPVQPAADVRGIGGVPARPDGEMFLPKHIRDRIAAEQAGTSAEGGDVLAALHSRDASELTDAELDLLPENQPMKAGGMKALRKSIARFKGKSVFEASSEGADLSSLDWQNNLSQVLAVAASAAYKQHKTSTRPNMPMGPGGFLTKRKIKQLWKLQKPGNSLKSPRLHSKLVDWLEDKGEESLEALANRHKDLSQEMLERKPLLSEAYKVNPAVADIEVARQVTHHHNETVRAAHLTLTSLASTGTACTRTDEAFWASNRDMRLARPFFKGPTVPKKSFARAAIDDTGTYTRPKTPWDLTTSIYGPRMHQCDARTFWDTPEVKYRRLEIDWNRCVQKSRFRRVVQENDQDCHWEENKGQFQHDEVNKELAEIKESLSRNIDIIAAGYNYFCVTGQDMGESAFSMTLNQYSSFLKDAEIPDKRSRTCKQRDCDLAFIAANVEEDIDKDAMTSGSSLSRKKTQQAQRELELLNQENDDKALMRFEFLEVIVRLAIAKFVKSKQTDDVSDAVDLLCGLFISPCLCPEAVLQKNEFLDRLYCEEVEQVFVEHAGLLEAIFLFYQRRMGEGVKGMLGMEGFCLLCDNLNLTGEAMGLSYRDLKLIFVWSQMMVVDEIKHRPRLIRMSFVDFLESLGRLAERINPPSNAMIEEYFRAHPEQAQGVFQSGNVKPTVCLAFEYYERYTTDTTGERAELMRASADFVNPKTRPLAVKVRQLLAYIVCRLMDQYGVRDMNILAERIRALAKIAR